MAERRQFGPALARPGLLAAPMLGRPGRSADAGVRLTQRRLTRVLGWHSAGWHSAD
jgi:hypothetical protein